MTDRPSFTPCDPQYAERVQRDFDRQEVLRTMQISIERIEPGEVVLSMPFQSALTQQHGFLHAGVVATLIDTACGYAAFTLMPADAQVLSVEFKVNLMRPSRGDRFTAVGRVRKAGRTVSVVEGDLLAHDADQQKLVATMNGTMMSIFDR